MRFALVVSMVLLLIGACSKEADKVDTNQIARDKMELEAQATAVAVIQDFSTRLKAELRQAMAEGGPKLAIETCSKKAPELAAKFSKEGVITIRRVSDKARNPENAADSVQIAILKEFHTAPKGTDLYRGIWHNRKGGEWYSYHHAIKAELMCLGCHGPADKLAQGVPEALAKFYPNDAATGYGPGDVRGMFVIDMKWPEAKEYVASLKTDSL